VTAAITLFTIRRAIIARGGKMRNAAAESNFLHSVCRPVCNLLETNQQTRHLYKLTQAIDTVTS